MDQEINVCKLRDVPNSVIMGVGSIFIMRHAHELKNDSRFVGKLYEYNAKDIYSVLNELLRISCETDIDKTKRLRRNKMKAVCKEFIESLNDEPLINKLINIDKEFKKQQTQNLLFLEFQNIFYDLVKTANKDFERGKAVNCLKFDTDKTLVITPEACVIIAGDYNKIVYQEGSDNQLDKKLIKLKIFSDNKNAELLNPTTTEIHQ